MLRVLSARGYAASSGASDASLVFFMIILMMVALTPRASCESLRAGAGAASKAEHRELDQPSSSSSAMGDTFGSEFFDEECELNNPCLNAGHCITASSSTVMQATNTTSNATTMNQCLCSIGYYGRFCNETDDGLTWALSHPKMTSEEEDEGNQHINDRKLLIEEHDEINRDLQGGASDWDFCSVSSECSVGCCSSVYSDDGALKCTPLDGGFQADICVSGGGPATPPASSSNPTSGVANPPQEQSRSWVCLRPDSNQSTNYGTVRGTTSDDAASICNASRSACEGQCTAKPIARSMWNCYTIDPIIHKGEVEIWWGHERGDAAWACNEWKGADCAGGRCFAGQQVYVMEEDSNTRWNSPGNTCSGNGGSCNAVSTSEYTISLATFQNDQSWDQVMGCGGAFELQAGEVNSEGVGTVTVGQAKLYKDWEGCCALAGDVMQARGLLSDGWKCAKDLNFGATRIDLLGKESCWKSNTRCAGGSSCNYCCSGYRWVWEWFGDHCN